MLTSGTSETSGLGRARRPRPSLTVVVFVVALVAVWPLAGARALSRAAVAPESLPQRLSDADFWRLTIDLSEPNGSFRSENLVSNEHTYQYVIPSLIKTVKPGGVYLGVAPDQNFTYMIAVQPRLAFIVDIRRGNFLQHLMYKAIFELSTDRADFLSRLFSKTRPAGIGPKTNVAELFSAFNRVDMPVEQYKAKYRAERAGDPRPPDQEAPVCAVEGGPRAARVDLLRVFLGRAQPAVFDVADRPDGQPLRDQLPDL